MIVRVLVEVDSEAGAVLPLLDIFVVPLLLHSNSFETTTRLSLGGSWPLTSASFGSCATIGRAADA